MNGAACVSKLWAAKTLVLESGKSLREDGQIFLADYIKICRAAAGQSEANKGKFLRGKLGKFSVRSAKHHAHALSGMWLVNAGD
jgi:hypothetical protein